MVNIIVIVSNKLILFAIPSLFCKKMYNSHMAKKPKIPATMVTQHPDHANAPYWHDQPFISTQEEPYECYLSFSELGATEYKWDWEGKTVDEAVV